MGASNERRFDVKLENGGNREVVIEPSFEEENETLAIADAVKVLLEGLGEDVNSAGLLKTPLRVAMAFREGTQGYKQKVNDIVSGGLFPEAGFDSRAGHAGGAGGLVIVRDLDFFSCCESCLLPFQVKCHIGYVPSGQRVLGLSKLSRVAEVFAKRLQDPQRLANEVCLALQHSFQPTGVAVVLQCSHLRFPDSESAILDPCHQSWIKISVRSGSGSFDDNKADIWSEFITLLRCQGINADEAYSRSSGAKYWCPSRTLSATQEPDSAMLNAVASILRCLGEDPLRKQLIETPACFLNWLMKFKNSDSDLKRNGFINEDLSCKEEHLCYELNLPLWSLCEHHLLPFHGVVHIGFYRKNGVNSVGKSLLQSILNFYGFKPQVQERLTKQIAEAVSAFLGEDVMVVVEANHTCMISRGVKKLGSSTATVAVLGRFLSDPMARLKLLQIIPNFSGL